MRNILLTGGAGFIGSNFAGRIMKGTATDRLTVLDKLTYAGNLDNLDGIGTGPRFRFVHGDICDIDTVRRILEKDFSHVVHMAAESHVERSIESAAPFIQTNVSGTLSMLEACRAAGFAGLFLHVSTDEVFGELWPAGKFTESTPYHPNSPYSASKAASDHLVRSYSHTYGFPAVVVNCSNNYGPRQHQEKLIPRMILNCLAGEPLTVHGDGYHVRDWLHVDDCTAALDAVLDGAMPGETFCIGGGNERTNLEIVEAVCSIMDDLHPQGRPHSRLITFTADRPGNDRRYAVDTTRIRNRLGWQPQIDFTAGMRRTAQWYVEAYEKTALKTGEKTGPEPARGHAV